MSVILSLDGNIEAESAIEIEPEDDFNTFLRKARSTLGYDLDLSCITDNQNVSLTDNLLDFLIGKNLEFSKDNQNQNETDNTDEEIIYVLNETLDDTEILFSTNENDSENTTYLLQNSDLKVAEIKDVNSKTITHYTLNKREISNEHFEECFICKCFVKSELLKSYMYDGNILNEIRQKNKNVKNVPKVVCDSCLDENYEKMSKSSNVFSEDEVLVVKSKVQNVYRRKNNSNTTVAERNISQDNDKLHNTEKSNSSESDDSESGVWIIQASDTWPDNLPKLASTTPVYDVSSISNLNSNNLEENGDSKKIVPNISETAKIGTQPRFFQCSVCKKKYASLEILKNHSCEPDLAVNQNVKLNVGKNVCSICGVTFLSKIRLQFHMRHFHSLGASGYLSCPQCPGCVFDTEDELYDHINFKHPKEKSHICPHENCGKSFQSKKTLTSHLKSHTDQRSYTCNDCGKQFLDKQTLNEHGVIHMKVKPFQCYICLKYLNRKSRLHNHLKTHESAPIFAKVLVCKGCDLAFKDGTEAQQHFKAYGICPDSFQNTEFDYEESLNITSSSYVNQSDLIKTENNTNSNENGKKNLNEEIVENEMRSGLDDKYKNYVKIVYIDKVYRCEFCEKVYSITDSLNLHRSYHEPSNNPYTCHICGASFPSYSQCTTHKNTHGVFASNKNDEKMQFRVDFPVIKHFLCDVCDKSYFHWTYLHVHRKKNHTEDTLQYPCKTCGEVFSTKWSIAHHNKKIHAKPDNPVSEKITDENSSSPHVCKFCGIHARTKSLLLLHTKNVHRPKKKILKISEKYTCKTCKKYFDSSLSLKVHMKSHKPPKEIGKHHCKKCGKDFSHATNLTSHDRRVHKKEMNYTCPYCEKNFYNSCDLKYHVRTHTGERPYSCSTCSRAFRTKGMRNEHLRIHTEKRPYPCDICGLSFKRSFALKNHRVIHTGEKRFQCPYEYCLQRFRLSSNLKSHIKQDHKSGTALVHSDENSHSENIIHLTVNENDTFNTNENEIVIFKNDEAESFLLDQTSSDHCIFQGMSQIALNSEVIDNKTECIMIENDGKVLAELLDSGIFQPGETVLLQDDNLLLRNQFIVSNGNEVIGELVGDGENFVIKELVEQNIGHKEISNNSELLPSAEFVGDWHEENYYVEEVHDNKVLSPKSSSDSQTFEDLFYVVENN